MRKHITAVIGTSAVWMMKRQFVIIAGHLKRFNCWAHVQGSFRQQPYETIVCVLQENWCPGDGVIEVSKTDRWRVQFKLRLYRI